MLNRRDAIKTAAAGITAAGVSSNANARSAGGTLVVGAVGCGGDEKPRALYGIDAVIRFRFTRTQERKFDACR